MAIESYAQLAYNLRGLIDEDLAEKIAAGDDLLQALENLETYLDPADMGETGKRFLIQARTAIEKATSCRP